MGRRELVALFVFLVSRDGCVADFLTMLQVCLQFVIVVFPVHTPLLFLIFHLNFLVYYSYEIANLT